jgi:hypothetical protein
MLQDTPNTFKASPRVTLCRPVEFIRAMVRTVEPAISLQNHFAEGPDFAARTRIISKIVRLKRCHDGEWRLAIRCLKPSWPL